MLVDEFNSNNNNNPETAWAEDMTNLQRQHEQKIQRNYRDSMSVTYDATAETAWAENMTQQQRQHNHGIQNVL